MANNVCKKEFAGINKNNAQNFLTIIDCISDQQFYIVKDCWSNTF